MAQEYQLDQTDVEILEILQADARIPLTQLSEQLGVPHATLRDRLRRLEEAGVIGGYTLVVNPAKAGFLITCFVQVTLDHRVETSKALKALSRLEGVTEVHLLTGETDILVRLWARNIEHLREILYDKFTRVPGLVRTNTLVVLDSQVRPLPLAAGK